MGKVVNHFLWAVCAIVTRAALQSTESSDLASNPPKATVFVTCQPCLTGACRTGHQMDNIMSAFIAAALMDGRGPGNLPWRYMHQTSNRRNGNDAAEIFALDTYKDATKGYERMNLPSLSAKVRERDPAATPGYTGERWHGHADYDKVMKVLKSAGQQCVNTLAKKRVSDNSKPLACVLELQFAWRLTLPRVYVWTQTKGLRVEVLQTVRAQLLSLYCQRMSRVPATHPLLFEANNGTTKRRRQLRIASGKESVNMSESRSPSLQLEGAKGEEGGGSVSFKKHRPHQQQRRRALKYMGRREEDSPNAKKKEKKASHWISGGEDTARSSSSVVTKVAMVEKHMQREFAKEGAQLERRFDDSSLWRRRQILQAHPLSQPNQELEQQKEQRYLRLKGSFPLVKHNSKHQREEEKAEARAAAAAAEKGEDKEASVASSNSYNSFNSSSSASGSSYSPSPSDHLPVGALPPLRIVVHARRGDRVRDSDNTWVHDTGGDVTSIAQIVGSIAAQAEACGLGEEASQQQQQQRGIEVSVHSESSNSGDLYNIPWDETTLRLMRMGAKRKMKHVDGGGGEEALPSDSKLAKVHTKNALSVDLAHFVAGDVFVMTASALSNLAAFLRGARSDWSGSKGGGGGFVVTDLRNDHLPEVQYPKDPILAHPDPAFYHGWNASLGFVASDDDEKRGSDGTTSASNSLKHAPRCALFAAPSPPQPVCAAFVKNTANQAASTSTSTTPNLSRRNARNRRTTFASTSYSLSNQSQATSQRHATLEAVNTVAAAQASKALKARQRSQAAMAGAAAHVHTHAPQATPGKTSASPPLPLSPSVKTTMSESSTSRGVQHRLPQQSAPHLVEAYLEKGQLTPPRPPIKGMEGKHVKHPFGLFG